jgi:FkbM family methyltransferase
MPIQTGVAEEALRRWSKALQDNPRPILKNAQEVVPPYFITKYQDVGDITLLIANREGVAWYDQVELSDLAYCLALGMIRRGDTVFDCGANQGLTSLVSSLSVGLNGRVISFEPFPLNAELIRINCMLNGTTNVQVVQRGVADYVGDVTISNVTQCIYPASIDADDALEVSITRLDEFAELRPHFIKIDIEGAELLCLRGAKNILSQAPAICLEFHPEMIGKFGVPADELFKILSTESYRVYVRYEGSSTMERYKFERVSKRCWFYCVPANRSEISRTYLPD